MNKTKRLPLKNVTIKGGFWEYYTKLVREKVIPYQWEVLNDRVADAAKSHCVKNFEIAAKRRDGQYYGMVFQDSDLYKWLESTAYCLAAQNDDELEKTADWAIELIGAAQRPDGYVNTYYSVKEPDGRWTNLNQGHELYCAGHLIEAAVAYGEATGKTVLLDIAKRFADYIGDVFGVGENQIKGYPGHQIIEMALYRLYLATKEEKYLKIAKYFLSQRGAKPHYFDAEREGGSYREIFPELRDVKRTYNQSHMAPADQRVAVGHAVRAVYMYAGMADILFETEDEALRSACDALYGDITQKQTYISGAIGATHIGESFTADYDLPNDTMYGETCASVGLMMFADRMNLFYGDAKYADVVENALYNTVLAGISLGGTEFFYVNPLEVEPRKIRNNPGYAHVKTVRQKWFDCSCCPTNIARTIMSLGKYAYSTCRDGLYVHLYCSGSASDNERKISVDTSYPYGSSATIVADGGKYRLCLRNPRRASILSVKVGDEQVNDFIQENGYVILENDWRGQTVSITFDMSPKKVYASLRLQNNIGKAAVARGPLLYCAEEVDNGAGLGSFILPKDVEFTEIPAPDGLPKDVVALSANARRYAQSDEELYKSEAPQVVEGERLILIPYYLWANRGDNEMRVYLNA